LNKQPAVCAGCFSLCQFKVLIDNKNDNMALIKYFPALSRRNFVLTSFLAVFLFTLGGCSKELSDDDNINDFNPAVAKTMLDESYGGTTRQVADVYLPANRSAATKVIIMLHGGSWAEGDKSDLTPVVNIFRSRWPDAAVINMNYTLAGNTVGTYHPAQMNDINTLLDYVRDRTIGPNGKLENPQPCLV
jgi:acetyl esterase/lipase